MITQSIHKIQHINWDIQNYVQFAKNNKSKFLKHQETLMSTLNSMINNKKGDLEKYNLNIMN